VDPIRRATLVLTMLALIVPAAASAARHHPQRAGCPGARPAIGFYRAAAWRWQSQHDAARTPSSYAERHVRGCGYLRWSARLWQHRALVERHAFDRWLIDMLGTDGVSGKWGCVHHNEGAWNASNDGYGGGLQMDSGFQSTYGAEFQHRYGWASGWPVWAQLVAAERAYHGYHGFGARGFTPWPNTARACGLA
jgi:hypothetical protein